MNTEMQTIVRDLDGTKKDLDFKFGTAQMRIDTLELRYQHVASDNKALEEALNECFRFSTLIRDQNKESLCKTASSIYQEIAVLANYHRTTVTNFEARMIAQEERHAKDMQKMEARMIAQEERHAKDMQKMEALLENTMELSEHSDEVSKWKGDYELVSDSDSDDIFVLSDRAALKESSHALTSKIDDYKKDLPIAQSLSGMLYDSNYPTL